MGWPDRRRQRDNRHHSLGYINPALYAIGSNPAKYAADFYDLTTGNNQADPSIPGHPATQGWDPVTGLGTPNAAKLLPDLIAQVNGIKATDEIKGEAGALVVSPVSCPPSSSGWGSL